MTLRGTGRSRRPRRRRRRLAALLPAAALVAVSVSLGSPAAGARSSASASAASAPASAAEVAPFFGEPVELTDDAVTTPTVASGTYTTEIDSGEARFLNVTRSIPGSTVWIGVSTQKPADYADLDDDAASKDGTDFTDEDILDVDISADGNIGQSCGDSFDSSVATPSQVETEPFQTALFNSGGEACRDAKTITVQFGSTDFIDAPIATQLVIWEEPPVADQRGLPQASRTVAWAELPPAGDPEPITPGTSYADAPDVSSGTFSFHVDRGQPAFFRMPLDWGQHGQALLTTDATFAGGAETLGYPMVRWVGPMGGVTQEAAIVGGPKDSWRGDVKGADGERVRASASPIVAWNQRKATDPDGGLVKYRMSGLAGSYFLVVAGNQALTDDGADITLQTGYFADYAGGAPSYDEQPSPMPQAFDAGPDAVTATSARVVADDRPAGPPWTTIWVLVGVAALVAVVGGGTLAWKGRTA